MLDCRVEGEEPISVTWLKNGKTVPTGAGTRTTVLSNGTLLIRSFQKKRDGDVTDAGDYHCAAQNRYGMLVSRKARVQLACKWDRQVFHYHILTETKVLNCAMLLLWYSKVYTFFLLFLVCILYFKMYRQCKNFTCFTLKK